ncbi:MAG TPA: response regulator [Steroidobacteraceae bacterium]|jgi:CheY-like chemotaxis protein|nr:response regulator [Steroidobacteraceae bacterium]
MQKGSRYGQSGPPQDKWDKVEILLVEDIISDAELTVRALRSIGAAQKILRLSDGVEALDFIFRKGRFSDRDQALPKLILLDLKMPRVGGIEFLQRLRQDSATQDIVVAILTSFTKDQLPSEIQDLGVHEYLLKPVNPESLIELVRHAGLALGQPQGER